MMMWVGLMFSVGTLISLTYAGVGLGSEEVEFINAVAVFKQANILGIWSVPVPNITFFTIGLRALLNADFAFFGGFMQLLQWFFYTVIGLGVMWGVFSVILVVISGLFRRITG